MQIVYHIDKGPSLYYLVTYTNSRYVLVSPLWYYYTGDMLTIRFSRIEFRELFRNISNILC